jgi:two-component system CheB/CheR fusion protein
MLRDIVQAWTAIPVIDIVDGMALAEDVIHIAPPHTNISINHDVLSLSRIAVDDNKPLRPIDALFNAMAGAYEERAVAVVLSGTGSDGALGVKAIKAQGGLTIAQGTNRSPPQYADMPAASIATGAVDLVLSIEEIPTALLNLKDAGAIDGEPVVDLHADALRLRICAAIRAQVGHDFSGYRDKTFNRRVLRRMQALEIASVPEYTQYIEDHDTEGILLFRDLLIRVTSFFRDPAIFQVVTDVVMPRLFANVDAQSEVRLWVPGCATGEEAYSLAMVLREYMDLRNIFAKVQIFATDIDDPAISIARMGRYPSELVKGLSIERQRRFFHEADGSLVVAKEIRELCTFSTHSLIRDPPFSRMNLVSCRNLLIYFDTDLQEKVIPLFHYSLAKSGILLLGSSESTARHPHLCEVLNKDSRIFLRRDAPSGRVELPMGSHQHAPRRQDALVPARETSSETITHRSRKDEERTPFMSDVPQAPKARGGPHGLMARLLNAFRPDRMTEEPSPEQMREQLKALSEQHQTALEELRSANEELHSVNEEMQSTNEELETSKEELQSVNEELRTVNLRLLEKVDELDNANSDLRNLFESTEIATVFLDRYLLIRSFTPAIANLYNLIPSDQGRPLTDIKNRLKYDSLRDDVALVLNTLEPFERRVTRDDGSSHYMMRILPYRNPDSSVDGTLVTFVDITNIVQAEAALRSADERKDVFLATLSQELRNPLAPIRTAAGILSSSRLGPTELARVQAIISRQAVHMSSLLDDLLDISRVTRGTLVLKKEYVKLHELIANAIETLQPSMDLKGHHFEFLHDEKDRVVEVDPMRITQVVTNLLENATKYTPPDGRITLTSKFDGTHLIISVKDTGIGLTHDKLLTVFSMFNQVDPRAGPANGLGIGLSLVKGLVEMHGGTVTAISDGLGEGSTFTVRLPRSVLAEMPAAIPFTATASPEEHQRKRILIADDNKDGAAALEILFRMEGHEVFLVHGGVEAVEMAALIRPQVVILDIGMPELSGYEVAQRLRNEAWGADLIMIALTGWGQEADGRRTLAAGFDHHLTKPVDPIELSRLIQ